MDNLDKILIILMIAISSLLSGTITFYRIVDELQSGKIGGYHCQPIKKVQTLEEAKALIEGYHAKAMARG